MRIGLILPMATGDVDRVLRFARRAEELGFDGLFAFDHLFPPGAPPDRPSLEAYATLAAVAASTSVVRIGTLVTRASLRPVAVLAKQVATLDELSGGRFVLGIGTGDVVGRREHEVFGLPYLSPEVRRAHLVETVRALKALFAGERWGGGEHVPPIAGPLLPEPRTPGGPPIWVGGTSEGAVRVAAQVADGWNGWAMASEPFAERCRLLRSEMGERPVEATWGGVAVVGRDAGEVQTILRERRERRLEAAGWSGTTEDATAWLAGMGGMGVGWAILLVAGGGARIELVAERVLPAVRATA